MDRIKEFPVDDRLWWVSWVDYVQIPFGRTNSPGISVMLSALPDGTNIKNLPLLEDEGKRHGREIRVKHVLAGFIPGLTIGTVFWNGLRAGRLRAPSVKLTFSAENSHLQVGVWPIRSKGPAPQRRRWRESFSYYFRHRARRLLPSDNYPLPEFDRSLCLLVRDDEKSVVIPCFEVFRAFYAPHQEIALALLSGPWDGDDYKGWHAVANPEHTGYLPGGVWQIGLRRRIKNEYAATLANLILNPKGREAANGVYAHFLRDRQHRYAAPAMGSPLRADIPFDWTKLEIEVRYARMRGTPNQYLGFEITVISWPTTPLDPDLIERFRDNDGTRGLVHTEIDLPSPFVQSPRELIVLEDDTIAVTSDIDPGDNPTTVLFPVIGPLWLNTPPVQKGEKPESFEYVKEPKISAEEEAASEASPGEPSGSSSEAARAQYSTKPRRTLTHRFTQVLDLLKSLDEESKIESWGVVPPPYGGVEFRGDIMAWPFATRLDRRKSWCIIDHEAELVRSALVCEITLMGTKVLWFEIETRTVAEAYFSLLIRTDELDEVSVIRVLMRIAERRQGKWPKTMAPLELESGATRIRRWKHWYDGKGPNRPLDKRSALKAIRDVAGL